MQKAAPAPKQIHIFKPGRHTTVAGEVLEFTAADLAATAAAYDPAIHKAPIVKGHPAIDAPAQGWATGLTARRAGLYAQPAQVDPAFAEEARAGRWGTVSAKFYRPDAANNPVPGVWYLRHIGVLGAHPPGVKGLESPEFGEADGDDGCVCFSEGVAFGRDSNAAFGEWSAMTAANLFRQLREFLVTKFGMDDADKVLPNYDVRALELAAQEDIAAGRAAAAGAVPAFGEGDPAPADPPSPPPPEESTVTEEQAQALRDQNAQLQQQADATARELAAIKQSQAAAAAASRTAELTAFAEGLVEDGKLPEADKARIVAFGEAMRPSDGQAEVMFGEGDAKKPLWEEFKAWLQGLPPKVEFGEHATRGRAGEAAPEVEYAEGADPERIELDKKIRAYMAENKVTYAVAAARVAAQ